MFTAPARADERKITITAQDYQSAVNEDYTISGEYSTSSFYYGKNSIGSFYVSGDADLQGSIKGFIEQLGTKSKLVMVVSLTLFIARAQIILYAYFRHAIVFLINNRSGMICFCKSVDALMDHTVKNL